jgi:hypothetical protein
MPSALLTSLKSVPILIPHCPSCSASARPQESLTALTMFRLTECGGKLYLMAGLTPAVDHRTGKPRVPGAADQHLRGRHRLPRGRRARPEKILHEATRTLDFGQPIAVILLAVMQFIPDSDGPHQIVSRLMDAVPPGSYPAMSNATLDFDPSGSPAPTCTTRGSRPSSPRALTPRSPASTTA